MGKVSGGDRPVRRAPGEKRLDHWEIDVRDEQTGCRQRVAQDVREKHLDLNPVGRDVRSRGLDSNRIGVDAGDRAEAEPRRRDRDDAGTAARVQHTPSLVRGEQLDACPRGRVSPGAERLARVDDDRRLAGGRGLPRRADPQPADPDGTMKRAPTILPPKFDGTEDAFQKTSRIRASPAGSV